MKLKVSVVVYALIACVFAALSIFTDFFETFRLESIFTPFFTAFGMVLGFAISLLVLVNLAKSFLKAAFDNWNN